MECDTCANFMYDEELEEYICDVNMDEDDWYVFCRTSVRNAPITAMEMNIKLSASKCKKGRCELWKQHY